MSLTVNMVPWDSAMYCLCKIKNLVYGRSGSKRDPIFEVGPFIFTRARLKLRRLLRQFYSSAISEFFRPIKWNPSHNFLLIFYVNFLCSSQSLLFARWFFEQWTCWSVWEASFHLEYSYAIAVCLGIDAIWLCLKQLLHCLTRGIFGDRR